MKKKPLKIAIYGLLGLVVLVVITFVVVTGRIDGIAQGIIDRGATDAYGLKASTDSVSVSIFSGGVGVRGFRVANVEGFDAKHILALGLLNVNVELGTLFDETLIVPAIQMSDL